MQVCLGFHMGSGDWPQLLILALIVLFWAFKKFTFQPLPTPNQPSHSSSSYTSSPLPLRGCSPSQLPGVPLPRGPKALLLPSTFLGAQIMLSLMEVGENQSMSVYSFNHINTLAPSASEYACLMS